MRAVVRLVMSVGVWVTGYGSTSGLANGRDLKEGDRDPTTGRLILDPLKIPTSDQGAPVCVSAALAPFTLLLAVGMSSPTAVSVSVGVGQQPESEKFARLCAL